MRGKMMVHRGIVVENPEVFLKSHLHCDVDFAAWWGGGGARGRVLVLCECLGVRQNF